MDLPWTTQTDGWNPDGLSSPELFRVLIVEDSVLMRATLRAALERSSFRVYEASQGEEAIAHFRNQSTDAVILDAAMPVLNGFETCQALRRLPGGRDIPILMISGLEADTSVNKAYASGVTDFIPKPVQLSVLCQRLRRLVEASRNAANLRLAQVILESMQDMAFWIDPRGTLRFANAAARRLLRYPGDELLDHKAWDIGLTGSPEHFQRFIRQRESGLQTPTEMTLRTRHDKAIPCEVSTNLHLADGQRYLCCVARDISERRAREQELAASRLELQMMAENAPLMIVRLDRELRYAFANRAFLRFTGTDQKEIVGCTNEDIGLPESLAATWRQHLDDIAETGEVQAFEFAFPREGEKRILEATAAPEKDHHNRVQAFLLFCRDVTEERRFEEERFKNDRLEMMGVLAGGIAHDFNNILTGLMNGHSLVRAEISDQSPAASLLEENETALTQAKRLSQQLLTFAKGGAPIKRLVDFGHLVRETTPFILRGKSTLGKVTQDGDLWPAEVDEGQLTQVLSNLIINADQAMPNGGTIRVHLQNKALTDPNPYGLRAGAYLLCEIHDSGQGIPADSLPKIFDPYFTTKEKGYGLGLATVFSIIKRHGGMITARSNVGVGTTFSLLLPAAPGKTLDPETAPKPVTNGQGRILLLEDQDIISRGVSRLLKRAGFEVTCTEEGTQTLSRFEQAQQTPKPFDLLILDMTIPAGMGGLEVIRHLQDKYPRVRAIVSSGYSDDPVMADPANYGFCGVLPKPFNREQLLEAVSHALEASLPQTTKPPESTQSNSHHHRE